MADSRLNKNLQKKALRNIFLSVIGIIAVGYVLVQYGPQLLIGFSIAVEKLTGSKDTSSSSSDDVSYIAPPTLNSMESATNSAKIIISGYSQPKQTVKLYVNGELKDTVEVKSDKGFTFQDVPLEPGDNDIKAKAISEHDKESDYSTPMRITYVNKQPTLDIDSLSDGQSFSGGQSPLKVSGKTDTGNKVTVNGFWAISDDTGKFSYTLPLQNGENKIKVEATDNAGNKTTKEIKVTYSP